VGNLASRSVEPGKVVTPGRKVMTVADLSQVEMKNLRGRDPAWKGQAGLSGQGSIPASDLELKPGMPADA
jgi:hypothetical protein